MPKFGLCSAGCDFSPHFRKWALWLCCARQENRREKGNQAAAGSLGKRYGYCGGCKPLPDEVCQAQLALGDLRKSLVFPGGCRKRIGIPITFEEAFPLYLVHAELLFAEVARFHASAVPASPRALSNNGQHLYLGMGHVANHREAACVQVAEFEAFFPRVQHPDDADWPVIVLVEVVILDIGGFAQAGDVHDVGL